MSNKYKQFTMSRQEVQLSPCTSTHNVIHSLHRTAVFLKNGQFQLPLVHMNYPQI